MNYRYKLVSILALVILVADQAVKIWAQRNLADAAAHVVIPGFFNLVYVLNRGAAFGFLNNADTTWQTYFFIAVSVLAVFLIFHLLRTVDREDKPLFWGLGFILGGALGNLIDRIRQGEVIDFLDFQFGSYHWPAFNIADIAISLGAFSLLVSFYMKAKVARGL